MIRLDDVSKVYRTAGREVRALDHLSLEVPGGRFVAVRGHSGSGKSTLLSLVGGLALPSEGTVTVDEQVVSSLPSSARARYRAARIGFVFQLFHLLPYLSVLENVLVAATGQDAAGRAEELLRRFGLAERLRHRPGQLSIGERQRVAMARALLNRPAVLLADEPTGNLDPSNAASVLELIEEFHAGGGTVLLVTHDAAAAARAQEVVQLADGRLVTEATQVRQPSR